MTTPWISRPRWTCSYCNVTINDDVPSRTQHEGGLRHKGNVERSLREAYRKSERERAEDRANARAMQQIERLAQEKYAAQDAEEATASTSASAKATTEGKKKREKGGSSPPPKWKPTDKLAAYGAALPAYSAEQRAREEQEEQERAARQEAREKEGTAGEWQTIMPLASATTTMQNVARPSSPVRNAPVASSSSVKVPREKEGHYHSSDEEEAVPAFNVKKRMRTGNEEERLRRATEEQRMLLPTWTPMRLDTGVSAKQEGVQAVPVRKMEDAGATIALDEEKKPADVKEEDDAAAPASTSMFKKRKAGAGAGAKKVRAVI